MEQNKEVPDTSALPSHANLHIHSHFDGCENFLIVESYVYIPFLIWPMCFLKIESLSFLILIFICVNDSYWLRG